PLISSVTISPMRMIAPLAMSFSIIAMTFFRSRSLSFDSSAMFASWFGVGSFLLYGSIPEREGVTRLVGANPRRSPSREDQNRAASSRTFGQDGKACQRETVRDGRPGRILQSGPE